MSSGDGTRVDAGNGIESTVDYQIEELIEQRTEEIEDRIDELEAELQELDDFARISLAERRIKGNEANLTEFSESLTAFAERTFAKLNTLESQLEVQTLLLAEIMEGLSEAEGVEVNISDVKKYQEDQIVMSASADERLQDAIEQMD